RAARSAASTNAATRAPTRRSHSPCSPASGSPPVSRSPPAADMRHYHGAGAPRLVEGTPAANLEPDMRTRSIRWPLTALCTAALIPLGSNGGAFPAPHAGQPAAVKAAPLAGWSAAAPRDEIRPRFGYDPHGGPNQDGALVITADDREGLHGWFHKAF